ncbi:MAG: DUF4397 domain-containing protein, partial [Myxococcota bacterium]
MKPLKNFAFFGFAAAVASTAMSCGGTDCGPGTNEVDDECVATGVECGDGTQLVDGACVPGLSCGATTQLSADGTECVLAEAACEEPATLDTSTGQCVAPEQIRCGTGTTERNGVCIPSCEGVFEVQNSMGTGCVDAARVQIVHASPDPETATVDVYSGPNIVATESGTAIGDDFSFGDGTPVLKVASAEPIRITASDAENSDEFVLELPASTLDSTRYLLVVQGGVRGRTLEIAIYNVLTERSPIPGQRLIAFVHASPDAPAVSGGRQETYATASSAPLFTNISYGAGGGTLDYNDPGASMIPFDVYPTNGDLRPLASLQTSSGEVIPAAEGLMEQETMVLIATGLLEPADGEPGLQVLAVTPDGRSGVLDAAARLQVVHAAVRAVPALQAPSSIDVYLGEMGATAAAVGTEVATDLDYQNASPFQSYVAGVPNMLQVTAANDANLEVNEPFTPMMGQTARLVVINDGPNGLTLRVVNGAEVGTGGTGTIWQS